MAQDGTITMKLISTSPIFTKVFLALTGALAVILSAPALAQANVGSLQDLAQGLDDFAPNVPEKPLRALVPDATPSATSTPASPAPTAPSAITPIPPAAQPSAAVVPTPRATNPGPAIPADWSRHEMAGLSIAAPPDWSIIDESYHNLQVGDMDKAMTKGVMLMIGVQRRNPRDEKLPPEMKLTPLEDTDLGGHIFSHSIIRAELQGIKIYSQMFISKDPYVKTRYSDENYAVVSLSVTNLDPGDYKDTFATILASIKPTATEKPAGLHTAKNGFVTFALPPGWEVLQDKKDALSIQVANSYEAYLMVETGQYAKGSISGLTGPGKPTTILDQPAKLYMGETEITIITNGVGKIVKAVSRTYVLASCTAEGAPIVVHETAAPDWLESDGFGPLEAAIQISLPEGTKNCTLDSQTSQNQIMPQEESADKYNRSKLHKAVLQGDLEKINYLLNSGEDVNIKDKLGRTPLHYAASQGKMDVAKFLLEKGADINSLDSRHWTPLFFAYFMGRVEMAKYLLASGADATVKDKSGKLASHYKK